MSNRESRTSNFEWYVEIALYPSLFILPYMLFRETITAMSQNRPWASFYLFSLSALATLAVVYPHLISGLAGARRRFFTTHAAAIFSAGILLPVLVSIDGTALPQVILISLAAVAAVAAVYWINKDDKELVITDLIIGVGTIIIGLTAPYIAGAMGNMKSPGVIALTLVPLLTPLPLFLTETRDDPRRPMSRLILLYLTESVSMSTYFIIFRSFESFRLPQQTVMVISLSFILLLFFVSSFIKGRLEIRKSPFHLPIFIITILSLISFVFSPNFFISLKEFSQYAFVVLNFYLIIHCLDAKKHYVALAAVFLAVMWIEAVIGVRQHFGANRLIGLGANRDPFSTLGNKNYVGEMLAMTIPFALALSVGFRERWKKLLCWLVVYPCLIVVLVGITRGSWIGLLMSLSVLLIYAIDGLPRKKAFETALHVLACLALAVSLAAFSTYNLIWASGRADSLKSNLVVQDVLDGCARKASFSAGSRSYNLCMRMSAEKFAFFHHHYINDWVLYLTQGDIRQILVPQATLQTHEELLVFLKNRVDALPDAEFTERLKSRLDSLPENNDGISYVRIGYGPADYTYKSRLMSMLNIITDRLAKSGKMRLFYFGILAVFIAGSVVLFKRPAAKITAAALILGVMIPMWVVSVPGSGPEQQQKNVATQEQSETAPSNRVEDSIVSRSFIWGGTGEMIRHYPLGVGLGAYKIRYLSMLKSYLEKTNIGAIPGFFKDVNAKEAHCEYLHIWAELGPLGLLALLFFIFTLIRFFYKVYYKPSDDTFTKCVSLGAFSALCSVGASAILGFPFHIIGTSMLCGLLIALLVFSEDRLLGVETLPADIPGFKSVKRAPQEQEKPKDKKKKKRREETAPAPAADPSAEFWSNRWIVIGIDSVTGFIVIATLILFFFLATVLSYNIQMSNILMKQANYAAKQAGDVLAQAETREKEGKPEEARMLRQQSAMIDSKALSIYDDALRRDPFNGDIHLFRGMYFQKSKDYEKALNEFLEARRYFDLPQITLDLGAIYFEKGEGYYEQAAQAFLDSLGVYPNYPLPRYNLGLIYYQKAYNLVSAPAHGQSAADGSGISILNLLGSESKWKKEGSPRLESREEIARFLFLESTRMFEEALRINPGLDSASFKLALTYERLYELEKNDAEKFNLLNKASQWYQYTLGVNRGHTDAYYNLALVLTKKSNLIGAEANRLAVAGMTEQAAQLRASSTQQMTESKTLFEHAVQIDPKNVKALNNLGNLYFNDGKVDEALNMYRRALAEDPNYLNARLNVALAFLQLGQYEQSLAYLNQLMQQQLEPQHEIKVIYMVGTSYFKTGRVAEAEAVLARAVSKYRNTPYSGLQEFFSIVTRYAEVLDQQRKPAEAVPLLEELLNLQGSTAPGFQNAEALYLLGVTSLHSGHRDKGVAAFQQLVKNHPGSPLIANARRLVPGLK